MSCYMPSEDFLKHSTEMLAVREKGAVPTVPRKHNRGEVTRGQGKSVAF